jgi:hypothetical protein
MHTQSPTKRAGMGSLQDQMMVLSNGSSPLPDCSKQLCDFLTMPVNVLPTLTEKLVWYLVAASGKY